MKLIFRVFDCVILAVFIYFYPMGILPLVMILHRLLLITSTTMELTT